MERELEQKRVNEIIKVIDYKSNKIFKHLEKVGGDALEIRQNFWNDVTVNTDEADDLAETFSSIKQQAQLLLERERSQSQLDKQINTLFRLKNSPYFGRVDFLENNEPATESIYIGISSLMDEKDEDFLIFDWRAPISSLYYDYSPGEAKYITPEGTIEGIIELKRQFLIRNSVIQGMFDTGITIGDEMLQEVLGNNANSQMKSIVATIQKEQNRIIRDEKSKLLIVQGVAGSGKTSAALQRVAYLLYRYRGKITSQNIMLFSPNPLFNSYVSTVLPELGEENMQQSTFLEFLSSRVGRKLELEDSFMQLESLLSSEQISSYELRMKSIKLKSSLDYKNILDDYIQKLNHSGLQFHPIVFKGKVLLSAEDITEKFYRLDKQASIPSRMEDLKEWLLKEIRKHKR
ncbi:RNA polymerase recycling motor HelD, partial [Robertmurraya sp.]|uniref:RNA polymerase recycling motor HelD n=1 Tax=Robertmurraya sp. TaxID=2837525 RepID=UPI003703F788